MLDATEGRVDRFSAQGEYLGDFDGSGTFEVEGKEETDEKAPTGKLLNPRTLAVDNFCIQRRLSGSECHAQDPSAGDVYVADFGHEVIDKFSAVGHYLGHIQIPVVGSFMELLGVTVDAHGHLWIAEDQGIDHRGFDELDDAQSNNFIQFVSDKGVRFRDAHPALVISPEGNLFAETVFESPFEEVVQEFTPAGVNLGVLERERSTGVGGEWTTGDIYVGNGVSVGRFRPHTSAVQIEQFGEGHLINGSGIGVNAIVTPGVPVREGPVYVADAGAADVITFALQRPERPSVEDVSGSNVTSESAILKGIINPRGALSEYRFEYGVCSTASDCKTSPFEFSAPDPGKGVVGASLDFEEHEVKEHPISLRPNTTYHFRLVARNEKNAPEEWVHSAEVVFKTQPAVPVERVLDARGWEMVSPPHKHGTLIRQISEQDVIQAAAGGSAFTFETDTPTEDEPKGFTNFVQVLARRTRTGWVSEDLALSHFRATGQSIGEGEEYRFFSEDLSVGLVQPFGVFEAATAPEATEQTPYLRTNFMAGSPEVPCVGTCYRALLSDANVPAGVQFGEQGSCPPRLICGPVITGASPNGRHIILRSAMGLTEGAGKEGGLYEWSNGAVSFVSALPNGQAAQVSNGVALGGGVITRGAVSVDGTRVVWTGNAGKGLFVRDFASNDTAEVNRGVAGTPHFLAASSNGSRVFFTAGSGELYVYESENDEVIRLSTSLEAGEETRLQGQLVGMAEDGLYVYFVADGRLDAEAHSEEGTCNGVVSNETSRCFLYVLHESGGVWSAPKVVAVLSGADHPDFSSNLANLTARVSPDGRWLVFMSQLPLTGYDNRDAVSGVRDEEVFLYDSFSGKLVCVSCDPSGARPDGVEYHRLEDGLVAGDRVWPGEAWLAGNVPGWTPYELSASFYQSRYLTDGGRVFFNSSDALVPGDVNGTEDVYEFEPPGVGSCTSASLTFVEAEGGCVGLVSSGTSRVESAFLDASVSGSDVFVLTASRLSSADFDSGLDVYDAHECSVVSPCLTAFAVAAPVCVTESSCKAAPSLQPELFGAPASALFSGLGNVSPVVSSSAAPPVVSRVVLLSRGLAVCRRGHRGSRVRRVVCERQVRAKYAARGAVRKAGRP